MITWILPVLAIIIVGCHIWFRRSTQTKEERCLEAFRDWEEAGLTTNEWTALLNDMFNNGELPFYIHRPDMTYPNAVCGRIRTTAARRRKESEMSKWKLFLTAFTTSYLMVRTWLRKKGN